MFGEFLILLTHTVEMVGWPDSPQIRSYHLLERYGWRRWTREGWALSARSEPPKATVRDTWGKGPACLRSEIRACGACSVCLAAGLGAPIPT